MSRIPFLKVKGSYYQMGSEHGRQYANDIYRFTQERIALVESGTWSGGAKLGRQQVLALAAECVPYHEAYAPNLMDELRGMSDAANLSLPELIIANGFTDFIDTVYAAYAQKAVRQPVLSIDDCTAFIIPDHLAEGSGFYGQTWDMHDTATEFVLLLQLEPDDAPAALTFTTTGCIGQIGMNEHGLAVGINNLSGADGQVGVTWPFVVRKILQQDNIEDALACITEAQLAGAHNYLLFDRQGNGYNVEAMSTNYVITPLEDQPLVHTNHCLIPDNLTRSQIKLPTSQTHSENRQDYATGILNDPDEPITIDHLQQLTREYPVCSPTDPIFRSCTCGAAIMRPKTGDFWAVSGLPSENEYELYQI